jgi:preprotein translocase subunit SecY
VSIFKLKSGVAKLFGPEQLSSRFFKGVDALQQDAYFTPLLLFLFLLTIQIPIYMYNSGVLNHATNNYRYTFGLEYVFLQMKCNASSVVGNYKLGALDFINCN